MLCKTDSGKFFGKARHTLLNLVNCLTGRFAATMKIMTELGLIDTGDNLQSGKAEGFAICGKEALSIVEKLVFYFFKVLAYLLIVVPHTIV